MEPITIFGLATAAVILLSGGDTKLRKLLAIKLPESRLKNVDIIEREFLAAGLSLPIAAAAVVNSKAESGLNASNDTGDGGHSVGLFQLNSPGGAGKGMTVAERKDPVKNTQRIIAVILGTWGSGNFGKALLKAQADGVTDVAELAAIFCRDIERPKHVVSDMAKRRKLAKQMFPSMTK